MSKVRRSSKSRTFAAIGIIAALVLAAVGAISALVAKFTIVIERANPPHKTY